MWAEMWEGHERTRAVVNTPLVLFAAEILNGEYGGCGFDINKCRYLTLYRRNNQKCQVLSRSMSKMMLHLTLYLGNIMADSH